MSQSNSHSKSVSLLVPTKDRSDFVVRLLDYYADTGFQGQVILGDSSSGKHLQITADAIDQLSSRLNVEHREYPELNVAQTTNALLTYVETEYCTLLPDDDFLCKPGVDQCVQFLDSNPDYVSAHGLGVMFALKSGTATGEVTGFYYYRQGTLEGQTGAQRLEEMFNSYFVTNFSIQRTNSVRAMFQDAPGVTEWSFGAELLPVGLSAVYGKAKELDCLFLVRQHHEQRYALPDTIDWVTDPDWSTSYHGFLTRLVEALVEQDGITREDAIPVVKNAFRAYMKTRIAKENWNSKRFSGRVKNTARTVPGVRTFRNLARTFLPKRQNSISLKELLKPSSKYHQDFLPVYKAITKQTLASVP
ncbi:MAG: TIGR00180 family glycosyltransferase [SAR202 cluster bacterium]|nr:TIGR00180 family glycosyltransferase [SAR202 cluster bacterium]